VVGKACDRQVAIRSTDSSLLRNNREAERWQSLLLLTNGLLQSQPELFSKRHPGITCVCV